MDRLAHVRLVIVESLGGPLTLHVGELLLVVWAGTEERTLERARAGLAPPSLDRSILRCTHTDTVPS